MSNIQIEKLFNLHRLPEGIALIPIILYFPLGFVLAVVRFFIGLQTLLISCILPRFSPLRSFVLRVMCAVLGFIVIVDEHKRRDEKAKVIVTNHVSAFDHFTTALIYPNVLPSICELYPFLEWILGWRDFGFKQNKESFLNNIKGFCSNSNIPLLVQPEGTTTSGRYGLLKFCTWPFSLDFPLQPMTLHVSRPQIFQIAVSTLNSRWWEDLFWCLFVPVTWFTIRCLPVMEKPKSVSAEEFSEDVRQKVAADLQLITTDFTTADKAELQKKHFHNRFNCLSRPQASAAEQEDSLLKVDPEMQKMISQVKDVLPNATVKDIAQDLAQTKDVDRTITNILEKDVKNEAATSQSADTTSSNHTSPNASSSCVTPDNVYKAKSFSKSGEERQKSLEERKQQMLATARQRYISKHSFN